MVLNYHFFFKFVSYRSKLAVLSNVLYYTVVKDIFVHRLSYLTPPNNDICSIKKIQYSAKTALKKVEKHLAGNQILVVLVPRRTNTRI